MSQMNKGTPWKPGENKARTAPGKLASAQQSLQQGKQLKQEGQAMAARAQKNAPNLPGWANASNQQNAANKLANAKQMTTQAKQNIKANTRTGPTIGTHRPTK